MTELPRLDSPATNHKPFGYADEVVEGEQHAFLPEKGDTNGYEPVERTPQATPRPSPRPSSRGSSRASPRGRRGLTPRDHPRVDLSWHSINYTVRVKNPVCDCGACGCLKAQDARGQPKYIWRTLLHDMSGVARSGRVLAIMGPSGAGKTTLMSSFIGRLLRDKQHILKGQCRMNNIMVSNDYKRLMSMVTQDDIVLGKETARDAFYFSARTRLGVSAEEGERLTEQMIKRLSLNLCADTIIGIPGLVKGISGGEKKRVNIGTELITNPNIMILDEPTTGLDSVNAVRVGKLMRGLANEGRTVIATIHTPSSELFALFDDILLIGKGHVVYHGPSAEAPQYFASVGFPLPPRTNPSEFYMNLLNFPPERQKVLWDAWNNYLMSPSCQSNMSVSHYPRAVKGEAERLREIAGDKGASYPLQFTMLMQRALRLTRREPAVTLGRGTMTLFMAFMFGLFFFKIRKDSHGNQTVGGSLFLQCINTFMTYALMTMYIFPAERAIYLAEQANEAYNPVLYLLSKVVAEVVCALPFPLIHCVIVYFMVYYRMTAAAFFIFFFFIWLLASSGQTFGLCLSAAIPRVELVALIGQLFILPFSMVGGLFASTSRLLPTFEWLTYVSPVRYGFIGLTLNQVHRDDNMCPYHDYDCPYFTGWEYLLGRGFQNWHWGLCALGLIVCFLAYIGLAGFLLAVFGYFERPNLTFERPKKKRVTQF